MNRISPGTLHFQLVACFASLSALMSNLAGAAQTHAVGWGAGTVIAKPPDANNYGQSIPPRSLTNAVFVAAGWRHSLALNADGSLTGWGDDSLGQLDFLPAGATNFTAVACGRLHSLALRSDGIVLAAGDDEHGQVEVPGDLSNAVAVAAGFFHSLALRSDGTVQAWGVNTNIDPLGTNENFGQSMVPDGLSNVVAIAAGGWHSLALKGDGTLAAWGRDDFGQGEIPPGISNVIAIGAGAAHNIALRTDGTVIAWGLNVYGETNVPDGLGNVISIAAGGWHNLALKSDGTVVAWGAGAPGSGTNVAFGQELVPNGLTNVLQVAAGLVHSLALVSGPPPLQFVPAAASYSGLFYQSAGVSVGTSGAITVMTTSDGKYRGAIRMGVTHYSFSGHFDPTGAATNTIVTGPTNVLTLILQMDLGDNSQITGTIGNDAWLADALAYRSAFNAKTNPAPQAGKYTLIIPGPADGDPATPQGDGYGIVSVTPAGRVTIGGALADGTSFSQIGLLSGGGHFALYVPLYAGAGQLLGWLNFENAAEEDLGGDLSWIKPAVAAAKFYPAGFDLDPHATGSAYNPTVAPVTGFSNATVTLTDGNLSASISNNIAIGPNNRVTTGSRQFSLTLNPAQGSFRGAAIGPVQNRAVQFKGVVLQKQGFASGFFLGTNQSGHVLVAP